jgi:hypothetical protein
MAAGRSLDFRPRRRHGEFTASGRSRRPRVGSVTRSGGVRMMPFMTEHRRNQANRRSCRLAVTDGPFTETKEVIGRMTPQTSRPTGKRRGENDNMSHATCSLALRPLRDAGIIAAAVLTAPAAARAQTIPERALLNHFAATVFVSNALAPGSAVFPAESGAVNGERALLVRTSVPHRHNTETAGADVVPIWVNGESALLGSSSHPDTRRRGVPTALRRPADPKGGCPSAGAAPSFAGRPTS